MTTETTALLPPQAASSDAATDETTALLIRARGFIARGWCRTANAQDAKGFVVSVHSEHAVAWCMAGALMAAGMSRDYGHPAYQRLKCAVGGELVLGFNDRQKTVEPILAAFDRAIAAGGELTP